MASYESKRIKAPEQSLKRDGTNLIDHTLRGKPRKRPRYWDMPPEQAIRLGLPLERSTPQVPSQMMSGDNNACKVYCGFQNSAVNPSEEELRQFFNVTMIAAQGADRVPGESVVGVYINPEKRFAFIQFRNREEAAQALDLDGINFRGQRLRLGPATQAQGPGLSSRMLPVKPLNVQRLGIVSTQVPDGPNKIYIGGLPVSLTDSQIKELLSTYGALKAFHLFRDISTGLSRGYAFAEYRDAKVTLSAIRGLNGLQVADRKITVKYYDSGMRAGLNPTSVLAELGLGRKSTVLPSEVVCFLQMVTSEDLIDDTEYKGICEDVRDEASKHGKVIDIVVPRPASGRKVAGIGKVFVQMDSLDAALKVKNALEGRQFLGRTVLATFFNKEKFIQRQL